MDSKKKPYNAPIIEAAIFYQGLMKRSLFKHRNGVTKTQMDILFALVSQDSISMSAMSERLSLSREQATRSVQLLVKLGYVDKKRDENNRRVVNISLTEKGFTFLETHCRVTDEAINDCLEGLSDEDRTELIACSTRSAEILHQVITCSPGECG